VAAPFADGTATIPNAPLRTEVRPATAQTRTQTKAPRRRRWPVLMGWLVGAIVAGAAVAGAVAYYDSDSGTSTPPATTVNTPVTTLPPTTLPPPTVPPTTLPPATSPQINRGPGNGKGDDGTKGRGGGDVQKQLKKWLEELQKQFREAQNGD
jgi:hypothetical protein